MTAPSCSGTSYGRDSRHGADPRGHLEGTSPARCGSRPRSRLDEAAFRCRTADRASRRDHRGSARRRCGRTRRACRDRARRRADPSGSRAARHRLAVRSRSSPLPYVRCGGFSSPTRGACDSGSTTSPKPALADTERDTMRSTSGGQRRPASLWLFIPVHTEKCGSNGTSVRRRATGRRMESPLRTRLPPSTIPTPWSRLTRATRRRRRSDAG